jgi:dipeptidyl aminopeptidase/acylaminoacyl peptidase
MRGLPRTFTLVSLVPLLFACGDSPEDTVAATDPVPEYTAAQFFGTTTYTLVPAGAHAFSPDGQSLLISSDETGVFNAYELPVSGGEPVRLTDSTDTAVFGVSWFPDDRRILYTYDNGGDELNHVVVREVDGTSRDLTPGDYVKAEFLGWEDDGDAFYLVTTERNQKSFDVYRYSAADYRRQLVFENPGFGVAAISGDGRWLALDKPRTSADSDIYVVDLRSEQKEPVLVTAHEGNIEYAAIGFTPDNAHLLYATDEFGEFRQAWQHDLASGETSLVFAADWDVLDLSYSPDGQYRVTVVNADASSNVTLTETEAGKVIELPELPAGDIGSLRFQRGGSRIALIVNADTSPSNIHVVDLDSGSSTQLTNALSPQIDAADLVESEIVRYASFDGLEIPGVLYRPHRASAQSPVPAMVYVHGGPGGQSRRGYNPMIQHLVNHGYAVLAANNRGSSGYGKTFYHLDDRRHGEEDLQDIVYARKYLESLDWIDGDSVGVIGGSYGGYMVAAALAFEPEAFDVGINIFGVTNWVRTLESIPPWWEDFKEALYDEMGDPATDAERHRRISPLFHADNIVKPLLVVQGANDPRVLQSESDELVEAVQANEVPVEYVLFPDEGHGFRKRENRIAASEAYVRFLDKYLLK